MIAAISPPTSRRRWRKPIGPASRRVASRPRRAASSAASASPPQSSRRRGPGQEFAKTRFTQAATRRCWWAARTGAKATKRPSSC